MPYGSVVAVEHLCCLLDVVGLHYMFPLRCLFFPLPARFGIQYRLGFFDGADVVFPRGHFEGGFEAVGGLLQQAQFVACGDKFAAFGVSFADGVYGFGNFARCVFQLRPYAVFVRNSDVLGFRYEMRQGRPVCTQFRYRQAVTEYDGDFGERTVEQINVHEAGRVRRYRMDNDGNWLLHSEADQSRNGEPLGFVPVVDLVLEKTGFFAGRPPLMELAYLNVKHWQSQSDQDNIVHYVRVPLLQYRGSEDVQNVVAAAGNMISVGADGELNYVEHSGAAISAGVTAIEKLETDMQAAGAKLLTRTKLALTESQARDEAGREISLLRHYANLLEDAIGRVLDMMAAWHGLDDGGAVEISGSIDDNGNPESSVDVLVRMNAAGVLSNETLFEEAKRRGLLSDYLKWEDEAARLDSQSAAGLDFSGKRNEERPSE